jgi:glutaredoxin 3
MDIIIYSTNTCPTCVKAKNLFEKWGFDYTTKMVDSDREALVEMSQITNGARTVPQIVIDEKWIGGIVELTELHMDGFFN